MLNQKELVSLKKGDAVSHFLMIKKVEVKTTKANKPYLCIEAADKSFTVTAYVWDNFEDIAKEIKAGTIVMATGLIDEYNGTPQLKISSIRPALTSENVTGADFLAKSARDINVMKQEFTSRIEKISNSYLKKLVKNIFSGGAFDKFITAPAGKMWHHSYVHGLIEHTLEIMRICDLMCDIHPDINRDMLICGAMLHDFGKTEELSFDSSFEYTDKGKLIGHIVISAMLINEECKKIEGFPESLKNCLIHLVLSHQGKLEFASPVVPKTIEAITLYQADELSAKVNAYKNALAMDAKGEAKWTKYISLASTDLYRHGILPEDEGTIKTLFD